MASAAGGPSRAPLERASGRSPECTSLSSTCANTCKILPCRSWSRNGSTPLGGTASLHRLPSSPSSTGPTT
eukprot:4420635-Alexandrium_andersonii.AAC.1